MGRSHSLTLSAYHSIARRSGAPPTTTVISEGADVKAIVHLIDDDMWVRDSTCALLEACGYDVRDHVSAEAFLSHSEKDTGCLLTDYDMPGMTGIELLEHLSATGEKTPALIITGSIEPSIRSRANRIGVKVLQKPVGEEELIRSIEQLRSK